MPIRKENVARYPANWKSEIVPRIHARSHGRCECTGQCGQRHGHLADRCTRIDGEIGYRDEEGAWVRLAKSEADVDMRVEVADLVDGYNVVKIVLTVMHLDHTPENCDPANLLHACQGCHNRYDAPMRRAGIQARARAQRAVGDLFACTEVS